MDFFLSLHFIDIMEESEKTYLCVEGRKAKDNADRVFLRHILASGGTAFLVSAILILLSFFWQPSLLLPAIILALVLIFIALASLPKQKEKRDRLKAMSDAEAGIFLVEKHALKRFKGHASQQRKNILTLLLVPGILFGALGGVALYDGYKPIPSLLSYEERQGTVNAEKTKVVMQDVSYELSLVLNESSTTYYVSGDFYKALDYDSFKDTMDGKAVTLRCAMSSDGTTGTVYFLSLAGADYLSAKDYEAITSQAKFISKTVGFISLGLTTLALAAIPFVLLALQKSRHEEIYATEDWKSEEASLHSDDTIPETVLTSNDDEPIRVGPKKGLLLVTSGLLVIGLALPLIFGIEYGFNTTVIGYLIGLIFGVVVLLLALFLIFGGLQTKVKIVKGKVLVQPVLGKNRIFPVRDICAVHEEMGKTVTFLDVEKKPLLSLYPAFQTGVDDFVHYCSDHHLLS
jgi:hypothetical protein